MPIADSVDLDRGAVRALARREARRLDERTPASAAMFGRARRALSGGVMSSFQARRPWPIFLRRGEGSRVWDDDGNELLDFHNAFGSMLQGHGHPAIGRAIAERYGDGTHFASPTEDAVGVAELLTDRWGLPQWRFTNSGTEATMDAIRIARAVTGRSTVLKVFGSFHGHHDTVLVSTGATDDWAGMRGVPLSVPHGEGVPESALHEVFAVHFNDAEALEARIRQLEELNRKPACMILEPAMMNLGVVLPEPGYLEAVREITRRHDVVLIFDEVKTGLSLGPGGATKRFGVQPDLVTLAKALGGGLPTGAIGGSEAAMRPVESGTVFLSGTFNGNPLAMAAARASLDEVLTDEAHERLERLNSRILDGCRDVIARHALPAYAVGAGAKGCVTFSRVRIVDFRSYAAHQDGELTGLAWLYGINRGIYMAPGREEEWTLSVAHDERTADRYVEVFEELACELTSS